MRAPAFIVCLTSLMLLAGQAQAEPIDYKELLPLLNIDVPGWTPGAPTGQTVTSPVEASEAVLQFTNGDMRLEVAIYDGGPAMASAMSAVARSESETPEEVVKPLVIKGFKGALFLHPKDNEADLVVMVPDRFAVSAHLAGGVDGELLKSTVTRIDLEKLAQIGKAFQAGHKSQADQAGQAGQAGQEGQGSQPDKVGN
jgi:hypothetical protein